MEPVNNTNNRKNFILYFALVLLVLALAFGGVLFFVNKNKTPQIVPVSDVNDQIEVIDTRQSIQLTELDKLYKYYTDNNIEIPAEYYDQVELRNKIRLLKTGVIEREVDVKSGAVIVVNISPTNQDTVKSKLEEYKLQIQESTNKQVDIPNIFEKIKADSVLAGALNNEFTMVYNKVDKESVLLPNDKLFQEFWGSPSGKVSDLYELEDKMLFYVITDTKEGRYRSYQNWLNQ